MTPFNHHAPLLKSIFLGSFQLPYLYTLRDKAEDINKLKKLMVDNSKVELPKNMKR